MSTTVSSAPTRTYAAYSAPLWKRWLLTRETAGFSGNFLIDDQVLRQAGVTDLSAYTVDPSKPLLPDLYIEP